VNGHAKGVMKETKCLFKMSEAHHQMRMGGLFFLNPPPFLTIDLAERSTDSEGVRTGFI